MFVIILALALQPGVQHIYTNDGPEAVRFTTYEACAARAKQEVVRLSHAKDVRGEFELYCTTEDSLHVKRA